ncbi:unnamed protein product [Camellia sinensis]
MRKRESSSSRRVPSGRCFNRTISPTLFVLHPQREKFPIPDEKLSLSKSLVIREKDSGLAAEKKSGDPTDRGVTVDGRCLFRAVAHVACLRNEEAAPDENHQRELADVLKAQVVY